MKKLSLIMPAHNEEGSVKETIVQFHRTLQNENILHEILVIDDGSKDRTEHIVKGLMKSIKEVKYIRNKFPNGFGLAVRKGLEHFDGDYAAIVMADLSDSPVDLIKMYKTVLRGYDCVFGSRFIRDSRVIDYPIHKLILNRIVNNFIKILFWITYNDVTNAFKLYSKETISGLKPFLSNHFNLTVELPLKAIVRGYSYTVVPTGWTNRVKGISKLKIKEMGSRYFFIILYCYLEKILSMGDYRKK